tara:strand:+ start:805 stop:1188 length:384 start_codon:yes stop_codon:yes gene_type:complete
MSTLAVATIKSASSAPPAFQNTSGTEIGTLCRAWVNFNGTGTVAIRASFNVSSITDHSTGTYSANFATAFSDFHYATTIAGGNTANSSVPRGFETVRGVTTSAVRFDFRDESGNEVDPNMCAVICMR